MSTTISSERPTAPNRQQALLDVFAGRWLSRIPPTKANLFAGTLPFFEDPRIAFMLQCTGRIDGFRVIELGPMECGHTYMLSKAGAGDILAIEGGSTAYLKCLIIKQLFEMTQVRLLYADFADYLASCDDNVDLCLASGVLYHSPDPIALLRNIRKVTRRVFIWTHYYQEEQLAARDLQNRFSGSVVQSFMGVEHKLFRMNYGEIKYSNRFNGGLSDHSLWMERRSILQVLADLGFTEQQVSHEEPNHEHGPAFCVMATCP